MSHVMAPISIGELLDKITILEIKFKHVSDARQRANIEHEHAELEKLIVGQWTPVLVEFKQPLADVNQVIWDLEDLVRSKHDHGTYDAEFIDCAVSIFQRNDERAAIKKQINERLGSKIVEEKLYVRTGEEGT